MATPPSQTRTDTTGEKPVGGPLWDDRLLADPHNVADKRLRVKWMFSAIAPSYDLNNRLHSLGMDQRWRRRAVKLAKIRASDRVVDVACGTGDLTQALACAQPESVLGVDFTLPMLEQAASKLKRHTADQATCPGTDRAAPFHYLAGDALSLPLPDASVDVVTIAFGIRNVSDSAAALREFRRVLRPGGRVLVLEFSLPGNAAMRAAYNLYFRQVLPRTATALSGDQTGAYKYLPESVNRFMSRDEMRKQMEAAGFKDVAEFPMTLGICICYRGYV